MRLKVGWALLASGKGFGYAYQFHDESASLRKETNCHNDDDDQYCDLHRVRQCHVLYLRVCCDKNVIKATGLSRTLTTVAHQRELRTMHTNAILHEAQQLYNVSHRLDSLAGQHPLVSEALITISGSVRNTVTLLEVLVVTKIAPLSGLDPANPDSVHRCL
jgi:hypothetical protein